MLTIRSSQIAALADARTTAFVQALQARLLSRAIDPRLREEPARLELEIRRGVGIARGFGISRQTDVARFVGLVLERCGCFAEQGFPRPALAILMTHGQDPRLKLDRFESWLQQQESKRVRA